LYPDDTDPGCPYCQAKTPIFTGNVMSYFREYYEHEILEELYDGTGIYYFSDDDFIVVSVSNSRKSWGRRILEFIYKGLDDNGIQMISAGYIREDGTR
jgi:hypothetical protein